jgi:peptidoglycan/LPS O-acetylase OafA/YrhL
LGVLDTTLHKGFSKFTNSLLLGSLALIAAGTLVIGVKGAVLLLAILLVLSSFVLMARHGANRNTVTRNADLRLRYFGIILLGFFSFNPFSEGIITGNWIESVASIALVISGYLIFEEYRTKT